MTARQPLSRNVAANVVNAAASILLAAVSVPLALHYVGLSGFGVWTLAQTALVYVATAETGFGPAVQRYVSVARGAGHLPSATRVVWSAAGFYVLLGGLIAAATALAAPSIVALFDVPAPLRADAVDMFRITGAVMLLALLAGGLANVLQGMERFFAATIATAITAVVFLVVAVVLLASGEGLRGLALAALAQQVVGLVVRVWMVRDVLTAARPALVSRDEGRELLAFSARLQVSVISTLVNSQTDKLVVGLLANTATVGAVGIASQAAEAVRFVFGAALGPVMARLAVVHGAGDGTVLAALYRRLEDAWLRLCVGVTAIATAIMPPLIIAWVGNDNGDAPLYAAILTFGYCVSTLVSPGAAYLRAVGRPGLEARLGAAIIAGNVVLTIALGIAFGALGVVCATAAAYLAGTAWFLRRVGEVVPPAPAGAPRPPWVRIAAAALVAAGAAAAFGVLMVALLPRGVALVPLGAGAGVALVLYTWAATGVRPTPAGVRALF